MSASKLQESMKDPVICGQYLAELRDRGKDVLVRDITAVIDSLIEVAVTLEAAERERDELRKTLQATQDGATEAIKHAMRLQEDIARRDAAAGEPVAWQYRYNDGKVGDWKTVDSESECNHSPCYERRAIYTAALPAVLPPKYYDEMTVRAELIEAYSKTQCEIAQELGCDSDKESILKAICEIKELGAQQQKPVICPPVQYLSKYAADDGHCTTGKLVPNKRTELRDTEWREALDAAGVKWEVKK